MEKLGQKDHDAIVLRFFNGKNLKDVGLALGASEDAAKKRVQRALEKLRRFFTKHGVVSTTMVISQTTGDDELTPQEIAKQSQDAYAALTSYSDNGTVLLEIAGRNIRTTFNIRLAHPNLYRLDWIMMTGQESAKGAAWSDGSGDYFEMKAAGKDKEKVKDMQTALGSAALLGNSAIAIPEIFFKIAL